MRPTTRARRGGGPSSPASASPHPPPPPTSPVPFHSPSSSSVSDSDHHPPSPVPFQSPSLSSVSDSDQPPPPSPVPFQSPPTSSVSDSDHSPPPPLADSFGFIAEACGSISPSQDALLRSSPFLPHKEKTEAAAALPTDIPGLTRRIFNRIFGSPSPNTSNPHCRYSDAATAEIALADYFLRLGPGRLHLLHQRQLQEGKLSRRTPFSSAHPTEKPEGVPPLADATPSCRPDAAAVIPTTYPDSGKQEKSADLKRGRPDSPAPGSLSAAADERSPRSKKPCVSPNGANHTGGVCSLDAGAIPIGHTPTAGTPPLADHGSRGSRKLPPSILCHADWEEGGVGDEGGAGIRRRQPRLEVAQEAGGKGPGAAAHAPRPSSPEGVSSADVPDVEEQGPDKLPPPPPPPSNLTTLVEESPASRVHGDATTPLRVGSDTAILVSSFIDVLLKFLKTPFQTPEDVDILELEALATKNMQLPRPKWWRPGGYARPQIEEGNGSEHVDV